MFSRLERFLVFLPLALSTATLICLVIIFIGCASPSSPERYYFMTVNLTGFPKLEHLNLGRSIDVAGLDTSSVANGAKNAADSSSQAADAAQHKANQVGDHLQDISDDLRSHLPAYYKVGLLGYCEGKADAAGYSKCSDPSISFSFDLLDIIGSASGKFEDLLPKGNEKVLAGYRDLSKWSIWAYIWGLIATVLATAFGIISTMFSFGRKLLIIFSMIATILITGGSIAITVIYCLITGGVQSILQPLGAHASLGTDTFVGAWLAVLFSLAACTIWLIKLFCCCI